MFTYKDRNGFTIVELIIVIVVIAILAAVTIVGYNGIQNQATDTAMKQELSQAAKQLELTKISAVDELYAETLEQTGIRPSEGRVLGYNIASDRSAFCLTNTDGKRVFFVTNLSKVPAPGICNDSIGVPGTGNIAQDSAPGETTVSASSSELKFTWDDVTCLGDMTPSYRWEWQVAGGGSGEQTDWTPAREQSVSTQGVRITGTIYARCSVGGNHSGATASEFDVTMPITSTPTLGAISVGGDSNASWSASGCPAGTTVQYRWQRDTAREAGGYNSYTSWGTGTTSGVTIGYDDQVTYRVESRCANVASGMSGVSVSSTSSTFTRGIPAPSAPGWVRHVVSNNTTMVWNGVGCSAGYPVYYMFIIRRSTGAVQWTYGPSTATSAVRPSLPVASWNSHVRAYCQGTYTSSGWSAENIAYT